MADIFKSRYFWEKVPFYKRKPFIIAVLILFALAVFTLTNKDNVQKIQKIEDIVDFSEEVEHFSEDSEINFKNISFKVFDINKTFTFFNDDLGIGVKADGVFYLVTFEILNKKSRLETLNLPTISLVGNKATYHRSKDAESLAKNSLKAEELPANISIKRIAIFDVPIEEEVHLELNLSGYRAIVEK